MTDGRVFSGKYIINSGDIIGIQTPRFETIRLNKAEIKEACVYKPATARGFFFGAFLGMVAATTYQFVYNGIEKATDEFPNYFYTEVIPVGVLGGGIGAAIGSDHRVKKAVAFGEYGYHQNDSRDSFRSMINLTISYYF